MFRVSFNLNRKIRRMILLQHLSGRVARMYRFLTATSDRNWAEFPWSNHGRLSEGLVSIYLCQRVKGSYCLKKYQLINL